MRLTSFIALTIAAGTTALAQDMSNVEIVTHEVADGIYMLEGAGGNIGLCVGDDGPFMIDDQFAPLTDRILAAAAKVSDHPVKFLVNTHWHSDHTGGNENLGKAGVVIVAHENVRERMSAEHFSEVFDRTTPPSPPDALPAITFTDSLTFHMNGDDIHVMHVKHAHTDGDAIIHFRQANVFHMGDTYFNGLYPFIDPSSGGRIDGVIDAVAHVLQFANEQTRFIPGHGSVSGIDDLRAYHAMLTAVRDTIAPMIEQGKTVDEVVAAKPTAKFDEQLGGGFLDPDQFVGIVYAGMAR